LPPSANDSGVTITVVVFDTEPSTSVLILLGHTQ
jgi:hypothetical protein